ncbi:MAG: thioredoxin domain-containing protein, partial [Polyangiaceae bacterium]|nr:thioredoxin domain-containing protein [Polyangiaceae bacterium]
MTDSDTNNRRSRVIAAIAMALSGVGAASSVYLTKVYIDVSEAMASGVEATHMCDINKLWSCSDVAASEYAAFLGIPVSVWGLGYFAVAFAASFLALLRIEPLKRWESLLFAFSCCGVPVTIVLAYIAASIIQSICAVCMVVYVVNTAIVVALGVANWKRFPGFIWEGLSEVIEQVKEGKLRLAIAVGVLLVLSQFLWVPRYFARETVTAPPQTQHDLPKGLDHVKVGEWLGIAADGNTLGPADAPIRIEEFTDFQCPFCGKAHEVMLELMQKYPGKIRLIHRDYPLDQSCNPSLDKPFHADACSAAYFARCAADQNLYWPFEALLFNNQRNLKPQTMFGYADRIGMDRAKLEACVKSKATHDAVAV